eukprot:6838484-Prymnesium_polylepis.3
MAEHANEESKLAKAQYTDGYYQLFSDSCSEAEKSHEAQQTEQLGHLHYSQHHRHVQQIVGLGSIVCGVGRFRSDKIERIAARNEPIDGH